MPTINQLVTRPRCRKTRKVTTVALEGNPQKSGTCVKVYTLTPTKPNSALRKVAVVRCSNGKRVIAFIPGEGHKLQEHSTVLLKGGGTPDLPGVRYKVVRGALDTTGVAARKRGRSLYGAKKPKQGSVSAVQKNKSK